MIALIACAASVVYWAVGDQAVGQLEVQGVDRLQDRLRLALEDGVDVLEPGQELLVDVGLVARDDVGDARLEVGRGERPALKAVRTPLVSCDWSAFSIARIVAGPVF